MKKTLALVAVIVALIGVITFSAVANTSGDGEDVSGNGSQNTSSTFSTVSVESIGASSTVSVASIENSTSSKKGSVGVVSVQSKKSSTYSATSKKTNATDKTESVDQWGNAQGKVDVSDISSTATSSKAETGKKIFNLSQLLKYVIFIPIALIIACVVILIKVNRKSFLTGEGKKAKGNKKANTNKFETGEIDISSHKRSGGKHTRKKR